MEHLEEQEEGGGKVSKHPQRSEQKIKLRNKCKMMKVMVAGREEEPVVVTLESIELDTVEQFVYLWSIMVWSDKN